MKKIIFILIIFISCSKDRNTINTNENYLFEDGFETQNNDLSELFPSNEKRWTDIQQVNPNNAENEISIENDIVLNGSNSLRVYSNISDNILSKMGIEKEGFNAYEGSIIKIEANFFISVNANADIENLFLIDLECCSCWDPTVQNNKCPGIRLMITENDFLSIERGKILGSTIIQTNVAFPKNEWVNIIWEMQLSSNYNGINKLFINNQQVISQTGINMPNKELFEAEFALNGINFQLQQPLFYERLQIGVTANSTQSNIEMFIDDVKLEINTN